MEKQRVNLMLDSDVSEHFDDLAGSERKRGLYISQLIRTTYAAQRNNVDIRAMDVEGLRLTVLGLAGRVQTVEGELVRTQSQLASLIANQANNGRLQKSMYSINRIAYAVLLTPRRPERWAFLFSVYS